MSRSSLCDYSDSYTHAKGTVTIPNTRTAAAAAAADNRNKNVIFKNCATFTNCISEIHKQMMMLMIQMY